jgi:ATP-binding cassette subfamily F protein uup
MRTCYLAGDSSLRSERRHIFNGTAVIPQCEDIAFQINLRIIRPNVCCVGFNDSMNPLFTLNQISFYFGPDPILDQVKFTCMPGERVCLIGRNGEGKSTFFKLIEGQLQPSEGTLWRQPGLKIARLQQDLPAKPATSIYDYVAEGVENCAQLLHRHHALTQAMSTESTPQQLKELEQLHAQMEVAQAWEMDRRIQTLLSQFELDADRLMNTLSGGWQRRAALARALVSEPDVLLLDEPTNHLDLEAIEWLEKFILSTPVTLLFITHDRSLLKKIATRIIELDRGQLSSWPGDYEHYLAKKAELLAAERKANELFDQRLAEEERWIRQGIQARRTRNEGRVRALKAMRHERTLRRERQGVATLHVSEAQRSGQLVIEAEHLSHQWDERLIVNNFSTLIIRGDRIGFMGPNGVGKTTLLELLLGKIPAQAGRVRLGTQLKVAYFDQRRETLDPHKTAMENVIQGTDFIEVNGQKKHIISYLNDFLFTPQRAKTQVQYLSGGETNRLMLAKLFSQPHNLLVMDEPTNDLDIETLELLEELLSQYQGTLLLVSHDREFLDQVVTSTLVFESQGQINEYVGGYTDWLRQRPEPSKVLSSEKLASPRAKTPLSQPKLSTSERDELKRLPKKIETLETKLQQLHQRMADPEFYGQESSLVQNTLQECEQLNQTLEQAYARWEELESKQG